MSASCEQVITLAGDLHARPAGALAVAAGRFAAVVSVTAGGHTADAKSVLGVMGLGATSGQHVTVSAAGPDAQEAVAALTTILSQATKVGGLLNVARLVRGAAQVGVVGGFDAVAVQPGHPDVVGVHRDDADAADQEQPGHRDVDPQRAGEGGQRRRDRQHDQQVAQREPAPPAGVGQVVPDPLPVPGRQPGAQREQHLAARAGIPGDPGHRINP